MFKNTCPLCAQTVTQNQPLCNQCLAELDRVEHGCQYCARPLDLANPLHICGACTHNQPPYDQFITPFYYDDKLSYMLSQLKFSEQLHFAPILGQLIVNNLKIIIQPDLIIPVPLHKKRLRKRGFNQALEIARPISQAFKLPIDRHSCIRIKHTQPQSEIPAKQRAKNVRAAFKVKGNLQHLNIAVIDDVMTTGNTIHSFCKALKKSKPNHIQVWTVAKTRY